MKCGGWKDISAARLDLSIIIIALLAIIDAIIMISNGRVKEVNDHHHNLLLMTVAPHHKRYLGCVLVVCWILLEYLCARVFCSASIFIPIHSNRARYYSDIPAQIYTYKDDDHWVRSHSIAATTIIIKIISTIK